MVLIVEGVVAEVLVGEFAFIGATTEETLEEFFIPPASHTTLRFVCVEVAQVECIEE